MVPSTEEGLFSAGFSALGGAAEAACCCCAAAEMGTAAGGDFWAAWAGRAGASGSEAAWGSGVGAGMRRRAQPAVAGSALACGAAAGRPLCMAFLCCTAAAFGRGAGACLGCAFLSCVACPAFGRDLLASAGCALRGAASAGALLLSLGTAALSLAEADSARGSPEIVFALLLSSAAGAGADGLGPALCSAASTVGWSLMPALLLVSATFG